MLSCKCLVGDLDCTRQWGVRSGFGFMDSGAFTVLGWGVGEGEVRLKFFCDAGFDYDVYWVF